MAIIEAHVYIGPLVIVEQSALIGKDSQLNVRVRIGSGSRLIRAIRMEPNAQTGARVVINAESLLGAACVIGTRTTIGMRANFQAGTFIGEMSVIGDNVRIGLGSRVFENTKLGDAVTLGAFAAIGANSTVGSATRLYNFACVESGSYVARNTVVPERGAFRVNGTIEPTHREPYKRWHYDYRTGKCIEKSV